MRAIGDIQGKRFVRKGVVAARDEMGPLNVAVVGYGYWGPNLVRNVAGSATMHLAALCERDSTRADAFRARMPGIAIAPDFEQLLLDPELDAVVIATPPNTHYALCKRALQAGKHVLVEKPLAKTSAQARELIELANQRGLVIMPGHTFLYSPAVNKVRDLIDDDAAWSSRRPRASASTSSRTAAVTSSSRAWRRRSRWRSSCRTSPARS